MYFPPTILYPEDYDSDRTLFLVFNSAEAVLAEDNGPWTTEIEIVPVESTEDEQWAENGFANIDGELFYYNNVLKNGNGKIYKFLNCLRNISGTKTKCTPAGKKVRGYVVAEHHRQLVDAIIKIEEFIGSSTCYGDNSIVCRINELEAEINEPDDQQCPEVIFKLVPISEVVLGKSIEYSYNVQINGTYNTYRLDFGDGNFTTTSQIGTHVYAPNSKIDPIVSITNDFCEIIQTPTIRNQVGEPPTNTTQPPTTIPIPTLPVIPDFTIPDIIVPDPNIAFPPLIRPCFEPVGSGNISIPNINISIPSVIQVEVPSNFPSVIQVEVPSFPIISIQNPNIPSIIEFVNVPSLIEFGPITIPSIITVVDSIPLTITVNSSIPDTININSNLPSVISINSNIPSVIELTSNLPSVISIDWGTPPTISVDWGTPPEVSGSVTLVCENGGSSTSSSVFSFFGPDEVYRNDLYTIDSRGNKSYFVEPLRLPNNLKIKKNKFKIENNKKESLEIKCDIPKIIDIKNRGIPEVDGLNIPETINKIEIDASALPQSIPLVVTGIPDVIEVKSDIPKEIFLRKPDDLQIELVYKGGPIPIQLPVQFDNLINKAIGNDDDTPCFALVPCKK